MKLLRYQAHNVLRIKDIDFNLKGHHLFLVGGDNEQGKSSAIKGLQMALCGRSGYDFPEVVIREGEDEAWVKVDLGEDEKLGDLTVELKLKRRRGGVVAEEFRVTDAAGKELKSPRSILERLYQMRAFDPLAFERLAKKEKRELLMKLVGLDFTAQREEHDRLYKERQDVNRDGKNLRARFDKMLSHQGVPEEEVSVAALMAQLDAARTVNAQNKRERDRLEKLRLDAERMGEEVGAISREVAELERKLAEARQHLVDEEVAQKKAESDYAHHRDNVVRGLVDLAEEPLKQKIEDADAVNQKVRENRAHSETGAQLELLRIQSAELTGAMENLIRAQQDALKKAKWPVEGLSVDDEGVLYNGLPIEQESTSRRVILSAKIGMALNPTLKLLVCQGGNDLGNGAMEALQQVLEEGGFQMILEVVTRSPEDEARCAVVIEDGAAKREVSRAE